MKIRIDEGLCTGHALCLGAGPDIIVLDDLGFNKTPTGVVPPELHEQARRAALSCPERAVLLEDESAQASA